MLLLAESVCLRRSERRLQDAQAHGLYGRIKLGGVNAVTVVEEKPVRYFSCDDFTELLERPSRRGMRCDVPAAPKPSMPDILEVNMDKRDDAIRVFITDPVLQKRLANYLVIDVVHKTYEFIQELFNLESGGELLLRLAARDPAPKWEDPR
jgi:hypothetical protein